MQRNGIILAAALLVSCASAAHAFRSGASPLPSSFATLVPIPIPISARLHPIAPAQPAEAPICRQVLGEYACACGRPAEAMRAAPHHDAARQ